MKKDVPGICAGMAVCLMIARFFAAAADNPGPTPARLAPKALEAYNRGIAEPKSEARIRWFSVAIEADPEFCMAYRQRGIEYRVVKDLERAAGDFTQVIEKDPKGADGYYLRGTVRGEQGRYAEAIADLTRALELQSGVPWAHWAYCYRAEACFALGKLDLALADLNKAILLDPRFAEAYFTRARVRGVRGDHTGALEDVSQALRVKPDFTEAYLLRATTYLFLRCYGQAWSDVEMCWRLGGTVPPLLLDAMLGLGEKPVASPPAERKTAAGGVGRWQASQPRLLSGDSRDAPAPPAQWRSSPPRLLGRDGKDSAAFAVLRQPLPDSRAARLFEAFADTLNAKTPEDRIKAYDRMIQLDLDSPLAYFGRGNACMAKEDYGRAIADFDRAIQLQPKTAAYFSNRAVAHAKRGDYNRALADLETALRLEPDSPAHYNNRANIFHQMRDAGRALEDCNRAILLGPGRAEFYSTRGEVYRLRAEPGRAITDFSTAIQLQPGFAEAYQHRALAYCEAGDFRSAQADVRLCQRLGWPVEPGLLRLFAERSAAAASALPAGLRPATPSPSRGTNGADGVITSFQLTVFPSTGAPVAPSPDSPASASPTAAPPPPR